MNRLRTAWQRFWFPESPLLDLAVFRIVVAGYGTYSLARLAGRHAWETVSRLPDALYDPLPLLHLFVMPFGWHARPSAEAVQAVLAVAILAGIAATIGWRARFSVFLLSVGYTFLTTYRYSFGEYHHSQGLFTITLCLLSLSPCGAVLSIDAWLRDRRRPGGFAGWWTAAHPLAQFPRRAGIVLLSLAYLSAATHKLVASGLDWMNGYTLQYYLANDAWRNDSAIGFWFASQHALCVVLSVLTIIWEATFWLVLLMPRLAWLYAPLGLAMHGGMFIVMGADFRLWMALYAGLVPWSRVWPAVAPMPRPLGCPVR